jgi:predicted RNA-binding protein with RPS1 domain
MSESFADLFEESLNTIEMAPGSIVTGTVVDIDSDWVVVHAGLKSEGVIPRIQFVDDKGDFKLKIGDQVKVAMEVVDDGFGETRLSREKARRAESWMMLEEAFEKNAVVTGIINGKVKGGFTVDITDIRAFLPGSLVDIRPLRETAHLEGKPLEFKVIKLDQRRNNVVVSRRAVLEQENSVEREALLSSLQEGQEVKGVVKNLTDYGAFVDLGGVDGLLHITDMAWRRIRHPSEMVNVGDEVAVKILKFDREKNRVSLGMKQLGDDPWVDLMRRYPEGARVMATVTNLTDYGCFAEIQEGCRRSRARFGDGLDEQEHPSVESRLGRRSGRSDGARHRRRAPPYFARHQAVPSESVGRVRAEIRKGRSHQGQHQVDHRLRHLHRSRRRHRWACAPFGHFVERARRDGRAPLLERRRDRDAGVVDRSGTRAHLAWRQATRFRTRSPTTPRRTIAAAW